MIQINCCPTRVLDSFKREIIFYIYNNTLTMIFDRFRYNNYDACIPSYHSFDNLFIFMSNAETLYASIICTQYTYMRGALRAPYSLDRYTCDARYENRLERQSFVTLY